MPDVGSGTVLLLHTQLHQKADSLMAKEGWRHFVLTQLQVRV